MTAALRNIVGLCHAIGDSIGAQYEFRYNRSREFVLDFAYGRPGGGTQAKQY